VTTFEGRPRLKAGCRLSPSGDVLLIPESVLRLQGPAHAIVQACDGTKTVAQIVAHLLEVFPNSETAKVSDETAIFLTRLTEKGVLEFV
jgi:pyrroloquinoline quinone biosynthesis protein D